MLYLDKKQLGELVEHSRSQFPEEVCGILAGRGERVEKVYQMTNKDKSPESFFMEPEEQFKIMKEIRNSGLDFIGIYHSHPETEAHPSAHDVELVYYPDVSYVIISLKNKNSPEVRSFKIKEGKIEEEDVKNA